MYQPVDFGTPQIYLAVAVILAMFAVPIGIHALIRRRRFLKDPATLQTFARRRDLAVESGVAALGLALAVVCIFVAGIGWKESERHLVANVETRYAVTNVAMTSWNGSWATVDLTDGNGIEATGIEVSFDAEGAPVLRDPNFDLDPKNTVEHKLDLR